MVESRFPLLSITRTDPGEALPHVPSGDGKLPTRTNPLFRTFKAVVSPSGAVPPKYWNNGAVGGTSTMVVPVPWRFELLLKFEIKMSPGLIAPPVGNPVGTKATPYGFTSPLAGTVETARTCAGRNGPSAAIKAGEQSRQDRAAPANIFSTPNFVPVEKLFEPVIRFMWVISL